MTASTRILLCRIGCVALCLVPTALVAGWTCWRASASFAVAQRADWERELTSRFGLVAEIGGVSYPGPGLARLDNFRLLDPESRQLVLSAAIVEVAAHEGGWQVELWQSQVQASGLGSLARAIEDRILRGPESLARCEISARELSIVRGSAAQSLVQIAAQLSPRPEGSLLTCEFHLPDAGASAEPVRLSLSRNRQRAPPVTRWQLDTAGQSLPCDWLAQVLPGAARLGAGCRFSGAAALELTGGEWSGEFAGRLAPLDLDALVTEQFPHQLSGRAALELERATIDRGQLAELRGTLRAAHGALSPSLLAAAQEHLQLTAGSRVAGQPAEAIGFQQLAIRFHLSDRSLSLVGQADPTRLGVLVASAGGPILLAPPGHAAPAVGLIRALLPESEFQVPAARQTSALIRLFPLPDAARTAAAHTPTRLAPTPAAPPRPAVRQPAMR